MEFSVLDLAVVAEGSDARQAIANSVALAQAAEGWGYSRFWLAEHHNMPGIASAATAVLIGHVADHTRAIRVGAGGVMLPNHAPLAIAEQFGTLATIHGPRIDLGLGRAPGGDGAVMHALRRSMQRNEDFPNDVVELLRYLGPPRPGAPVAAHPGEGTNVPVWILGSSLYGASLAAALGLPYAFASHFAPGDLEEARRLYRERFQPTEFGEKPRFMLAVNVIAAETDAEAQRLRSSQQISFARLRLGMPGLLPPPVDDVLDAIPVRILPTVNAALAISAVGSPQTVAAELDRLIARHQPDELILVGNIYDQVARHRSFAIAAEILRGRT
ncbi:LLM class flavin-dependent oxidoreductase [Paracoccus denitrificans]|jgi:luciferase family oxidoreductase group 1|uniref:Luciferase-like monooxygenase n=1 Tax=Paracoccus denitrificans (strain Pd 1222) TaxID=318586 RepID=A1AZ23_PARDP|nr:LLM class flavin-dependent oxidoreductase [Paracoccus denitrificans]ABL68517.1 luciferase family protein [Paracoccus denitrificans PD1222]MBB4625760.1 luciferase family oxidoreductase group 1 [Paracoccus denitrificans]MCU7427074.1 LLM class flavin-dependent oxidoreductase [Paracoccus denitrificans]QAR26588.1 LLM class flavin-dependent oxidoreductase [Paracoccus denitrificans]UPV95531.1 LLM class flavin-dependent oxidoreductase [Paracoccus denitrificans]